MVLSIRYLLFAVIVAAALPAGAHTSKHGMKYDSWCCNGSAVNGDCQEIPDSAVEFVPGGYRVTLAPGEHKLVTRPHSYFKRADKVRFSTDGHYHACLWPTQDSLRCLYVVPMGF